LADLSADLVLLLQRQREHCPAALAQIHRLGRKDGHWLWWAFPCDVPGRSEPGPATCLTRATALDFLQHADVVWWDLIRLIADTASAHPNGLRGVLPDIDLPRVRNFCRFWRTFRDIPPSLQSVITDLAGSDISEAGESPLPLLEAQTCALPFRATPPPLPADTVDAVVTLAPAVVSSKPQGAASISEDALAPLLRGNVASTPCEGARGLSRQHDAGRNASHVPVSTSSLASVSSAMLWAGFTSKSRAARCAARPPLLCSRMLPGVHELALSTVSTVLAPSSQVAPSAHRRSACDLGSIPNNAFVNVRAAK